MHYVIQALSQYITQCRVEGTPSFIRCQEISVYLLMLLEYLDVHEDSWKTVLCIKYQLHSDIVIEVSLLPYFKCVKRSAVDDQGIS